MRPSSYSRINRTRTSPSSASSGYPNKPLVNVPNKFTNTPKVKKTDYVFISLGIVVLVFGANILHFLYKIMSRNRNDRSKQPGFFEKYKINIIIGIVTSILITILSIYYMRR